jgi:hypothetical protein
VVVGLSFGLPLKEARIRARHTEDDSFLGGAHWLKISGDLSPLIYTCLAGAIVGWRQVSTRPLDLSIEKEKDKND